MVVRGPARTVRLSRTSDVGDDHLPQTTDSATSQSGQNRVEFKVFGDLTPGTYRLHAETTGHGERPMITQTCERVFTVQEQETVRVYITGTTTSSCAIYIFS